jgi:hypothetical protein
MYEQFRIITTNVDNIPCQPVSTSVVVVAVPLLLCLVNVTGDESIYMIHADTFPL